MTWIYICELIDTLWNVNINKEGFYESIFGINRYIMECKLQIFHC